MASVTKYFRDSIEELRHVRWPTRQQAIRLSIIVIGFTIICSAFFGFVDFAMSGLVKLILSSL